MDSDQVAALRFIAQRGIVSWSDIRSLTAMHPGTLSGLVLSGDVSARGLGEDNVLTDATELSLTDKGAAALPITEDQTPASDGLPVSRNQMLLF